MSALPELVSAVAERALAAFCEGRVPPHARHQVRLIYHKRGKSLTLFESRPPWNDPKGAWTEAPVARFDFDIKTGMWTLKCCDRNGRWHHYEGVGPTKRFEDLVNEVARDPTCIFWG